MNGMTSCGTFVSMLRQLFHSLQTMIKYHMNAHLKSGSFCAKSCSFLTVIKLKPNILGRASIRGGQTYEESPQHSHNFVFVLSELFFPSCPDTPNLFNLIVGSKKHSLNV